MEDNAMGDFRDWCTTHGIPTDSTNVFAVDTAGSWDHRVRVPRRGEYVVELTHNGDTAVALVGGWCTEPVDWRDAVCCAADAVQERWAPLMGPGWDSAYCTVVVHKVRRHGKVRRRTTNGEGA